MLMGATPVSRPHVAWVLSQLLWLLCLGSTQAACSVVDEQCICADATGNEWNVESLSLNDGRTEPVAKGDCSGSNCEGGFEYYLGLCYQPPAITSCHQFCYCSTSTPTWAYRLDARATCPPGQTCQCDQLGPASGGAPEITALGPQGDDFSAGSGLSVVYRSSNYSPIIVTTLNIICDPSATNDAEPEVVNDPSCSISWCSAEINWRTSAICPAGLATGWLIIIFMLCGAVLYVAAPIIYVRRTAPKEQEDGFGATVLLKSHPHWSTWIQIPSLVSEGIVFTRSKLIPAGWPLHLESAGEDDERTKLDATQREERTGIAKKARKDKKSSKAPKRTKSKTKTIKEEAVPEENVLGLLEVADSDDSVHPSQRKIKVVLGRVDDEDDAMSDASPRDQRTTPKDKKKKRSPKPKPKSYE
eukprot:SAG31_NODE_381_length_16458_cov_18.069259_10_plen_415_part_00